MRPSVWGPSTWRTLHCIAQGYPVHDPSMETQRAYQAYFSIVGTVLPCARCSANYARHLVDFPVEPALSGRAALFKWTVDLHNTVNTELGKRTMSYEEADSLYADRRRPFDATATMSLGQIATLCALIASAFVIALILRRSRSK